MTVTELCIPQHPCSWGTKWFA